MNIRDHIEAGRYERDGKGRAMVPTDLGGHALIAATDAPGSAPLIGWWGNGQGETQAAWRADGAWWRSWSSESVMPKPHLLPPPRRKVLVMAQVRFDAGGPPRIVTWRTDPNQARVGGELQITLTGECEEPWS